MSGYWARYQERQRKLAAGVDADLVKENHRRYGISFMLLGGGILLILSRNYVPWSLILSKIIAVISSVAIIGGMILLWLSAWERRVIEQPDPEKPSSILTPK
jgi:hypothetical protein